MTTKQSYWFGLVADQEESGLTIQSFCSSKDIKICTFQYWRRKFRQRDLNHAGFVELLPPVAGCSPLKITYPNGVCIELPAADITLLSQLLRIV